MLLSFPTRSCRSCMVDLQRKTEWASWADEPSPYSSPSPLIQPFWGHHRHSFTVWSHFVTGVGGRPTRRELLWLAQLHMSHCTCQLLPSGGSVCVLSHTLALTLTLTEKCWNPVASQSPSIHPIHITHTIRNNLPKTPNFQLNWAKMAHKKELVWRYLDQATWSLINAGHLEEEKWQWVCCTSHVISHWSLVRYLWQKTRIRRLYFNQRWDDATIERQQRGRIGGLEKPGGEDCGGGGGPVVMGFAKVLEGSPPCGKSSNPNPQFPGSLAL